MTNPLYLPHPDHPGYSRQVNECELRKLVDPNGKKDRWPDQGIPLKTYDFGNGPFQLYVNPRNKVEMKEVPFRRQRHGMKHRAYVICTCGLHVPVGRLSQHLNRKDHERWVQDLEKLVG
jgi:hypothetical protein